MNGPENKTLPDRDLMAPADELLDKAEGFLSLDSAFEDDLNDRNQHHSFSCPVDHAGSSVHVQGWSRIHSEMPPVIFVHDLGESSDLYAPAARILLNYGFNTYCFDMRGHGRSTPLENKVVTFQDLVSDLLQVVSWIRYKSNRRKPFLIGQGMGALVLMHFQKYYPQFCSRCVLLAPIFEAQTALPFFGRVFLKGMSQLLPKTRIPSSLLPYFLPMSDESQHRGNNELTFSSRFAYDLMQAVGTAPQTFADVTTPNLIACPIDDILYNGNMLRRLVGQHPHRDVFTFEDIRGISAQALSRDPEEAEKLLQVLVPWMQEICPPTSLI